MVHGNILIGGLTVITTIIMIELSLMCYVYLTDMKPCLKVR